LWDALNKVCTDTSACIISHLEGLANSKIAIIATSSIIKALVRGLRLGNNITHRLILYEGGLRNLASCLSMKILLVVGEHMGVGW